MGPPRRAAAISAASNLAATASGSRVVSAAGASPADPASKGAKSANGAHNKQNAAASSSASKPTSLMPPPPAQPLSPIVSRLRKMWKFAALCQFLLTFDEAFGMSGFDTAALESDLDGTETNVIPDLMRRLLYTLTLNRSIDEDNWEDHLRAQYIRRDPENTVLGSIEAPSPWHGLPLTQKVETLHTACEWQLWDAERFRKLVKNEEDAEAWRIESVGWDADENRYWLFDDNRLWVQHPPPPPPPPAKAAPKKSSKKAKAEARREAQLKRKRDSSSAAPPTSTTTAATDSTPKRPARVSQVRGTPATRASPRNSSSSGGQAASSSNGARPTETAYKRARPSRGRQTDEWEAIPASLLYGETTSGGGGDEDSDLSDPPEVEEQDESMDVTRDGADETIATVGNEMEERADEDGETSEMDVDVKEEKKEGEAEAGREEAGDKAAITTPDANGPEEAKDGPKKEEDGVEAVDASAKSDEQPEWVEFETIAVTRAEWEWIATRFAKSKHPDEKALHAYLKGEVVPAVMNDLDELEKQRAHEVAMANRKRSSRIALKESEKEERERDRLARQRMEDKMAAIREEEEAQVRREREEVEATRTREERLREREERLLAREREAIERAHREAEERERRERMREWRKMKREQIIANGGHPPEEDDESVDVDGGEQRLDDDSWELGCDVCGRRGVNLVESEELVCCEVCGVWQHTECWNAFDRRTGRAPRDWEAEDFFCSQCRQPAPGQPYPNLPQQQQQQPRAQDPAQRQPQSQPQPAVPVQSQPQLQHQQAPPLHAALQVQTQAPTQSQMQVQSPAAVSVTQSTQSGQQHPLARTLEADARQGGPSSSADTDPTQAASKPQYPSAAAYSSTVHQSPFPPYTTIYSGYGNQGVRTSPTMTNAAPRSGTSSSLAASSQSPANGASPHSPIPAAPSIAAHSPPSALEYQQARQVETMAAPLPPPQQATISNGLANKSTTLGTPVGGPGVSASPSITTNATEHRVPAPPATSTSQSTTLPAQNGSMSAPSSTPLKLAQSGAQGASSTSAPHSQSNGATATAPLAPAKVQSMSPKAAPLPVRSPSAGGVAPMSSSLPRNVTKHASGSFPLRHTPVRSPLSGPHAASPNAMPAVALPPPIRSGSPSPAPRSAPQQTVISGALPPQSAQHVPLDTRSVQPPAVPTSSSAVAPSTASNATITQPAPVPSSTQLQDPTVSVPVEKQPSTTMGAIVPEAAAGSVAQNPSTTSTAAQTH